LTIREDLLRHSRCVRRRGYNAIDTSDSYARWVPGSPGGESETIIGNWLKRSGRRDKLLIATKVGEDMGEGRSLKKDYILRECEASLRRLQTDCIDLYQTHFDDEVTPPEETMQAYAQLIAAGKVRVIGASNISPARLKASLAASKTLGVSRYESLQPLYNLSDRKNSRQNSSRSAGRKGSVSSTIIRSPPDSSPASTARLKRAPAPRPRRAAQTLSR
jgi:aryl-alcohol dehydrogenase-like predicted oxidoreductase